VTWTLRDAAPDWPETILGEERFAGYIVQLTEDRDDGDRGDRP
jgi:hypothetical protein